MRLKKIIFKVFLVLAVPAIILQPGYYSVAYAVDIFSKQPKNLNVPPLAQQQATPNLAQDNASQNTGPLLTPDQNTVEKKEYEDIGKRTEHTKTIVGKDGKVTKKVSLIEPLHNKKGDKWEDLNPKVSKLPRQLGGLSQVEPVSLSVGDFKMTALPLDQGINYDFKGTKFSITLPGSNNAIPKIVKEDGKDVVVYANAFKDVDLKYFISGYSIKEVIVLKNKTAQNTFRFSYKGITLKDHPTIKGALSIVGLPDDSVYIAPLNISTSKHFVTEPVISQQYSSSTVDVTVDKNWLKDLKTDQFPVLVDPTWTTLRKKPTSMQAIRSDGFRCGSDTCSPQVGNEEYPDYWASWRTLIDIPFTEVADTLAGQGSISARLHLVRNGGVSDNLYIKVAAAGCRDYNCAVEESYTAGEVSNDAWIDVSGTIEYMTSRNAGDQPLILYSPFDSIAKRFYKSFDLSQMYLEITYLSDQPAPTPQMAYPEDKKVISTLQPALGVTPVVDSNGEKVRYTFFLMSSPQDVITSSTSYDSSWTVPDGILKDGVTYFWSAVAASPQGGSPPGATRSFKVDLRKGVGATQSYDTAGPISIDQATGNASTSISSHSLKALGGNLGISLDYNTPTLSRQGLVAEYWDNTTLSGVAKATTVTPNINFDWGQYASPLNVTLNGSNFSARYSGYLDVPQTGVYTFGADRDDGARIYINDQLVLDAWGAAGVSYGTGVTLTAGRPTKIKVEYFESTGQAQMRLLAKGPTLPAEGQIVDRSWLYTGVRQTNQNTGLQANYYSSVNNDFPATPALVSGNEAIFDYRSPRGLSSRAPGGVNTDIVKYKGYIQIPTTGVYQFNASRSGGLRITINQTQILNGWNRSGTWDQPTSITLTAGQWIPIEIDYIAPITGEASLSLRVQGPGVTNQILPASWLSQRKEVLPAGWQLGVDTSGAKIDQLRINTSSVTLLDSSGSTQEFKWEQNAYIPPAGKFSQLTRNPDGTYNLKDEDGKLYVFSTDGTLMSMATPTDDKKPTALKYTYSGTPSRLTKITDGVNANRNATLYYMGINDGGGCAPPTGWDTVPTGYLCKVKTSDNTETNLRYKAGNLARVEGAGDTLTDFGYDTLQRIVQVRDPLANDAVRMGQRTATDSTTYDVTYDELGRASKVLLPAATSGAVRLGSSYTYFAGRTEQHKIGASEPSGYSEKIEYDDSYRTIRRYGHDGKVSTTQWHAAKDIILSETDSLGLKSTTIYDANDRAVAKYGPAPAAWFGADNIPTAANLAAVPKIETKFDEGMQGLSASFYDNKNLVREPKARTFERGNLIRQWTAANRPVTPTAEGWGVRLTGEIVLPVVGLYEIKLYSDDGVKAYIDDKLYIDDWKDGDARYHTSTKFDNQQANRKVKIRIDYYDKDQSDVNSKLELRIYKPGATEADAVQTGQFLVPNFSLPTSDSVTDSTLGKVTNTKTYNRPEYGTLDKITLDSTGLNYASTTTTEATGTGFFRQTSKTLPGGNKTTYNHYASTDTRDNPCTTAVETALQAGMPKGKTEMDPDAAGPLVGQTSEMIYDQTGQVVAARINSEAYTCTTYDARGRVTQTVTPASGSRPGMTSTTNYAVGGNPLKIATTDSNGSVTTEFDLLGRTVKYTDAYAKVTTLTYDTQGRLATKSSPIGNEVFTYDALDRMTKHTINGVVMAMLYYDEFSRIKNIDYTASNQKLVSLEYDTLLRVKAVNWQLGDGTTIREVQTKTTTGLVLSNTRTIGTETLNQAYTYDKAARLRTAQVGSNTMSYGFDAPPASCGTSYNPNAHKNTNRTSQIINGVTTTYCYDFADRLLSSSDANYNAPVYDDRGNIIQIGSTTKPIKFGYDQANRNIRTEQRDSAGNGVITELKRDAGGRIIARKEIKLTAGVQSVTSDIRYSYTTSGDSPDVITDTAGGILQRNLSLPGGISLSLNSNQTEVAKQRTYSIPNFHGDTMVTTDYNGTKTGIFTYDPFGNQLNSTTPPQLNSPPGTTYGYLGSDTRITETSYSIPITQMGDRIYLPGLGRFMQSDPVEGGNANAYIYPADPVNGKDIDGNFAWFVPVVWFIVTAIVSAVVSHVLEKVIDKVVPKPYQAPAQTALTIASFAAPGGAVAKVWKTPDLFSKTEKVVKNIFGKEPFKPTVVHGNSRSSQKPTRVYELWTEAGEYLKTGITSNPIPERRYSKSFMEGKRMRFPHGGRDMTYSRTDALDLERFLITKNPGPLNKERWLK